MCHKAVITHSSTIQFVPECYKTQKMCFKAVNICFFIFDFIPDQYKTRKMCDEAVDDSLTVLKFEVKCMQMTVYNFSNEHSQVTLKLK